MKSGNFTYNSNDRSFFLFLLFLVELPPLKDNSSDRQETTVMLNVFFSILVELPPLKDNRSDRQETTVMINVSFSLLVALIPLKDNKSDWQEAIYFQVT